MASSTAQIINVLSSAPGSYRNPNLGRGPKMLFLGQPLGKATPFGGLPRSAFLRLSSDGSNYRRVGPLRVVSEKVVGIDLGTTNLAGGYGGWEAHRSFECPGADPSVVVYTKNGDRLVGQIAKRQAMVNPENTFSL